MRANITRGGDVRRLAKRILERGQVRPGRMIGKMFLLAGCWLAAWSPTADAQLRRRPAVSAPPNWIGAGIAVMQQFTLLDGTTASQWRFDSGLGYTASFEHPTQAGLMLGFQGTY